MSGESLVDLLLVRLSKDEEKEAVLPMLVSILGFSEEEAKEYVENTPAVLSKCLPTEEARKIQDQMFPYIDLLPRIYGQCDDPGAAEAPAGADSEMENDDQVSPSEIDGEDGSYVHEFETGPGTTRTISEDDPTIIFNTVVDGSTDDLQDDAFVITSAAEEVQTVDRCHVCGRTPTDAEKLAPCRTCGDLTCSDCFDRIVHVCSKCASEGRVVDRPIKGAPEYRKVEEVDEDEMVQFPEPENEKGKKGTRTLSPVLFIVLGLVVIAAAFYFLDPLSLFGESSDTPEPGLAATLPADTLALEVPSDTDVTVDSLPQSADSSMTHLDSIPAMSTDTLVVAAGDSTQVIQPSDSVAAINSLRDLQLPEDMEVPDQVVTPPLLFATPVQDLEVLVDSLPLISANLARIMSAASVSSEGITLVQTPDSTILLAISILHPEPVEDRTKMVGNIATMLDGTAVDQMVIYYRESPYHTPELFSFLADSFAAISGVIGPGFLQVRQGALPGSWEMVSGPIMDWMTQLD